MDLDGELTVLLLEHRAHIDHRIDVLAAGVYSPNGRSRTARSRNSHKRADGASRRGRIARRGKSEDAEAAVGLDDVAEVDRLGVGEADDRRGMKARADDEVLAPDAGA